MRRNPATAALVEQAIGIKPDVWTGVEVHWETDELAICKVEFILSPLQFLALVRAGTEIPGREERVS